MRSAEQNWLNKQRIMIKKRNLYDCFCLYLYVTVKDENELIGRDRRTRAMNDKSDDLSEISHYIDCDDNTESSIVSLVDVMSYQERIVFVSYYYNQLSIEEIAKETGISGKTVRSCLTDTSRKVADIVGHTGMYYVALMIFLALGNEASLCYPP